MVVSLLPPAHPCAVLTAHAECAAGLWGMGQPLELGGVGWWGSGGQLPVPGDQGGGGLRPMGL